MYFQIKLYKTSKETAFLFLITIFCILLSIFRLVISNSLTFLFLNWNLFLAILPWVFSNLAVKYNSSNNYKITCIFFILWILFFPNSPYIITDLFHLRIQTNMPLWFDLVLILSFTWIGLLFGLISLKNIELIFLKHIKRKWLVNLLIVILLFLSSLGVYIGRFLRWNSWDIIKEPVKLIFDIGDRLLNSINHPRTWGMTLFMGIFLNLIYWSLRLLKIKNK